MLGPLQRFFCSHKWEVIDKTVTPATPLPPNSICDGNVPIWGDQWVRIVALCRQRTTLLLACHKCGATDQKDRP